MSGILVNDVWKDFDGTPVLNGISFEVPEGSCLVLLGPSGCGKTTTLRCIAGLEVPSSGEIALRGRTMFSSADGTHVPPKDRRIGFVFQNLALYPHMSVYKNLAFRLKIEHLRRDSIRERVREALRLVDLEGLEDRSPTELSGGQRQRVALARSIVNSPDTLLCDEPLSNLDPPLRASVRAQILALHKRTGSTMLYVTHEHSEAMLVADRIAVMARGEILQVGTPSEIYQLPATLAVAELTGELRTNVIPGEVHNAESRTLLIPAADPYLFISLPEACRRFARETVVFSVRPEDLEILPAPSEDEGKARVLAVMPRGTDYLVHLRVGEKLDQIVAAGRAEDYARLQPGQPVGLRFRRGTIHEPSHGRLLCPFGQEPAA